MKHILLAWPLAGLFFTSWALAGEPEGPPEATTARAKTSWYGYQALIADVGVVALTTAGGVQALSESYCFASSCLGTPRRDHTASESLLGTAAVMFLFASPTIHAVHGQWGNAAASLGLRALPIAIAVPLMADPRPHTSTWPMGAAVLVAGGLAAMIVDDAAVAREPVTKETARVVAVAPTVDAQSRAGGVVAVGTF